MAIMAQAWGLLTLEDTERQFMGNAGYEDVFGCYYSWDETVQNHDKVQVGDLAVLRDNKTVLGLGWIDEIDKSKGDKPRFRCPHCKSTAFKARKSAKYENKYKCADTKCRKDFPEPLAETLHDITFYRADYSRTWQPLDVDLRTSDIESAYLNNAKMNSIRPLDLQKFREILLSAQSLGETWWIVPETGLPPDIPGGHSMGLTKVRVGQQRFRQSMLFRFKSACAICGPLPGAILDAAHLYPYAATAKHDLEGGLLLRRDLHALFDRMMLLIDPDDGWRVRLDPRLAQYPEIWKFEMQPVKLPPELRPNPKYLRDHAMLARASWGTAGNN